MYKKLLEFSIASPLFFLTSCSQIPGIIQAFASVEKAEMGYEVKKDDKDVNVNVHIDLERDDIEKK